MVKNLKAICKGGEVLFVMGICKGGEVLFVMCLFQRKIR